MSDQKAFWAGEHGDEYTERNRVDWTARVPFWRDVIKQTFPGLAFELGCNVGANMRAIQELKQGVRLVGVDLNQNAVNEATSHGLTALCGDLAQAQRTYQKGTFDLVYTAGVLIHVPPAGLMATMDGLIDLSNKWVLAVEYAADAETEIEYRGQMGLLWKRPYGGLYETLGLELVREWDAGPGFDRCTAWLLAKP